MTDEMTTTTTEPPPTDAAAATDKPKRKKYRPTPGVRTVHSPDDLLEVEEILTLTGWAISTLDAKVAAGKYPKPIIGGGGKHGGGTRKWARKQHTKWVDQQIAKASKVA